MMLPAPLPVDWVKLSVFEQCTGYTPDAVQKKIKRGQWKEGVLWRRAEDGNILVSLRGYHQWVENPQQAA